MSTPASASSMGGPSTVPKPPAEAAPPQPPTQNDPKEDEKKMEPQDVQDSGIPVSAIAMKLLDVRLKPSSAISKSVIGEFTKSAIASKTQQIVVARNGGVLELYVIKTQPTPSLKLEHRLETRSILRDIVPVRLVGEKRDVLAVTSDSGCLSIVDFESDFLSENPTLVTSPYGKSGCRRSTPGQHLATDPKGRAICVSATEKRKLVYVLNQNTTEQQSMALALASPLEAHRTRTHRKTDG